MYTDASLPCQSTNPGKLSIKTIDILLSRKKEYVVYYHSRFAGHSLRCGLICQITFGHVNEHAFAVIENDGAADTYVKSASHWCNRE